MDEKFFISNGNHYFVKDGDNIIVPSCDASSYQDRLNWMKKVSDSESPIWAGLPYAAEDVLR